MSTAYSISLQQSCGRMDSLGEFDFINRLIKAQAAEGQSFFQQKNILGIGDDAALLPALDHGAQMLVATDMLVEGRHFYPDVDPASLGHKVLAVNLSDLAAMGGQPLAFTLAAGLRAIDRPWLEAFLDGMLSLARLHQCALVGGDTVRVPKTSAQVFSVTVMGSAPKGHVLRRSAAAVGDDIWVSGHLGDPSFALAHGHAQAKLNWPTPRLSLGQRLLGLAHAAIDISDGLQSELMHLLHASSSERADGPRLDATLDWSGLPLGPALQEALSLGQISETDARCFAASGGDEYELCFTAPESARQEIENMGRSLGCPLTRIGQIISAQALISRLHWKDQAGQPLDPETRLRLEHAGFDHFKS